MKKKAFLIFLCVALTVICTTCGITKLFTDKSVNNNITDATADTAENLISQNTDKNSDNDNEMMLRKNEAQFIAFTQEDFKKLKKLVTSDENIACVDSGGRVDGVSAGKATITAEFSDNTVREYKITVAEAKEKNEDRFSTCILANEDILAKNEASKDSRNLYAIRVNRKQNCVTVYTYDENGYYNIPVRAMVCSTGKNNSTITGSFELYFKAEWHALYHDVYGQYVSGISGDYLFHSVPYINISPDSLEVDEFNLLGEQASLGCVRMSVSDTKWIYNNCKVGTNVIIYDDYNPGPLGKPETIKITNKDCGWDPTDDNFYNPYYYINPVIYGAEDITIKAGEIFAPMNNIRAYDTCSNDITNKVVITGNVIITRKGSYKLTYSVTDALHRSTSVDITVNVV